MQPGEQQRQGMPGIHRADRMPQDAAQQYANDRYVMASSECKSRERSVECWLAGVFARVCPRGPGRTRHDRIPRLLMALAYRSRVPILGVALSHDCHSPDIILRCIIMKQQQKVLKRESKVGRQISCVLPCLQQVRHLLLRVPCSTLQHGWKVILLDDSKAWSTTIRR